MPLNGEYIPGPEGFVRDMTVKILETGTTDSVDWGGRPVILLTVRGAKSGKLRRVPLMRVEHAGAFALVASDGGAPTHPAWYHNLKAEPLVELQDGTETYDYRARELAGSERAIWWERAMAAYPVYAELERKTTRVIPVLILEKP
ncbi:nitroreductase family deazaflavin-dependent oxidoreductase [Rhodococcus opacus]|uniref:nitroreductase family deazaflavin-dependent oxidoreductase n=1 Tax=Rhodococcus opacus TaxID=37919 RepID=UPI00247C8D87|nr:deazaflavin-dependent oxidoreductase (nitroreductase family) [Rhodococcus opacus]